MRRSKIRRTIGCACGVTVALLTAYVFAMMLTCCPADVRIAGEQKNGAHTIEHRRNISPTLAGKHVKTSFDKPFQEDDKQHSRSTLDLIRNTTTDRLVTHVGFLKVHKAASTTIQNMLFRFALRHNLDILLPRKGNYYKESVGNIQSTKSGHFDILACHTVYSTNFFNTMLPADSVKISIVREPSTRMISAAYYFRDVQKDEYLMKVPKQRFIHNLVRHPEHYDRQNMSLTKNSMAMDFGFSSTLAVSDTQQITNYLRLLDREFLLVIVMERFDESLVLLRRLLNWSLLDIIYLRTNAYSHETEELTPADIIQLKKTNFLDYALYDFFVERLEKQLLTAGPDFYEEVSNFNKTLEMVKSFCEQNNSHELELRKTKWAEQFTLLRTECQQMNMKEIAFIKDLRKRQHQRNWINSDLLNQRNYRAIFLVLVISNCWFGYVLIDKSCSPNKVTNRDACG